MSWLFSRALVEEFSEASCSDGEPSAQLSVMPSEHPFWRNGKTMEPSTLSRFGLTCAVLTAHHGEAVLTSFLEGFPVRTFPWLATAQASQEPEADFGVRCGESLARFDHFTYSWKTAQPSLLGDLEPFLGTWPRWGLMRGGVCWELPTLVPPTSATAFGLLPTLTARDFRSDSCSPEVKATRDAHSRGKTLPWVLGGLVNPPWAEWFMGWVEGWTAFEPLETGKFQQWLQQHGKFSEGVAHEA